MINLHLTKITKLFDLENLELYGITTGCHIFYTHTSTHVPLCTCSSSGFSDQTLHGQYFVVQVQLFDLPSGASRSSLKGHGQPVTCISLFSPHMVASGSADKRVRVYDCRCPTPFPMLTLKGHGGCVKCVQMDQWKVVSGRYVGGCG